MNNTTSSLAMLKAFIWKQQDNISSHMTENKERRGKKRLISNFTTAHSRKSIHKRKKKMKRPECIIMSKSPLGQKSKFSKYQKWTKEKNTS